MRKKLISTDAELQGRSFFERFGILPKNIGKTDCVIHCASIGELNVAIPIIKRLLNDDEDLRITVSTTSLTGAVLAKKQFGDRVQHCFLPFDIPIIVGRFLKRLAPKLLVIAEVEFWPNLIQSAYKRKVKLGLINGRISSKSLQTYQKFSGIYKHTLRKFEVICAQSQSSYDNFLKLGVYRANLHLTNNIKFDLSKDEADNDKQTQLTKYFDYEADRILLGASTHEPEEQLLLSTYSALKRYHTDLRLILVPRHPHRFEEVYMLCSASGFSVQRLSTAEESKTTNADIWLIDAMGWLKASYGLCTLAFVGGSFAQKGGHNALECALYSKPIMMGPSIYNNPDICIQLETAGALKICENQDELLTECERLLGDKNAATKAGRSGAEILQNNAGAVNRCFEEIKGLL